MMAVNLSSTIVEDPRLKRSARELLIMILVGFVLYTIAYWSVLLAYGSNPRAYVGGIPWWFYLLFVSVVFGAILMVITYFMKEEPLDPWIKG
jgi:fatty acid desaturase